MANDTFDNARTDREMLDKLTKRQWSDQQCEIFDWFEGVGGLAQSRHLVVRARAGTGKTTTIVAAVSHAPERNILLTAFNKKIADELNLRLGGARNCRAKTLHSVGFASAQAFKNGLFVDKTGERADRLSRQACGLTAPDVIVRLVSKLHTKGREITPHATRMGELTDLLFKFECEPDARWVQAGYDIEYVERNALVAMELASKQFAGGIDFADMIFLPVRNGWMSATYDMVVVDEAQDMTVAQLELAQGVCKGRFVLVGDDRQAIYDFRGADSGSLDRLKAKLGADELGLTVTYRCGHAIVEEAQRFVDDIEAGPDNPAGVISNLHADKLTEAAAYGDFVLSRTNAPLVKVAMRLLKAGKRARIAGRDIGRSLQSVVKRINGQTSVNAFLLAVDAWETREIARLEKTKGEARIAIIRDQADTLRTLSENAESVQHITDRIEALFTDDGLGSAGLVTCSSVHRAKGLEARRVFVLKETLRRNTEEECNIQYVAITRAKEELVWVGGLR